MKIKLFAVVVLVLMCSDANQARILSTRQLTKVRWGVHAQLDPQPKNLLFYRFTSQSWQRIDKLYKLETITLRKPVFTR